MIIRAWRTKDCKTIDEYEVDSILIGSDDAEEAKEVIDNGYEPMLGFTVDGGLIWQFMPINFVIEIKEA